MDNNSDIQDIKSALWHIASALKGIELKLDNLENAANSLSSIDIGLESFAEPFHINSKFSTLVKLFEKQTQILEEQHCINKYRK